MILILALAFAIVFALPSDALAWGPGVHMALGNLLLNNLSLLAPATAEAVAAHPNAFLYGCLSADIFIGKGARFKPGHSHNWETGFNLLDKAPNRRTRSYAWGYLAHLTADISAHNYYVPNMLGYLPPAGRLSHVFLEAQADMRVSWDPHQARTLFRQPNQAADGTLLTATDQKKLLFLVRKDLFKRGLSVVGAKPWKEAELFVRMTLPQLQSARYLQSLLDLALKVTVDFLRDPASSPAPDFDPIGSENIKRAQWFWRGRRRRLARPKLGSMFPPDPRLQELPGHDGLVETIMLPAPKPRRRARRFRP